MTKIKNETWSQIPSNSLFKSGWSNKTKIAEKTQGYT